MVAPSSEQTLSAIESLLHSFERFGVDLGLDRIVWLLERLGNPHHRVPIVHVAGTNGKGSVCAYVSSVLQAAGYRVGRYTSPHLVHWCERICLDGQAIAPEDLYGALCQVQAAIDPDSPTPTQFEVITAAAWLFFAQQGVDVAVIEVGLGGRLDATNVCDRPLVSIITPLSLEHWQRLGPTLSHIAFEKAGILKAGCPGVIAPQTPEAQAVIETQASKVGAPLTWVTPAVAIAPHQAQLGDLEYPLALAGDMQLTNSALAIAAIEQLRQQGWQISEAALQAGMAATRWPGRLQWITWQGQPLLIDGAHNGAAAHALRHYVESLPYVRQGRPVTWVMGMLSTKDHSEIFRALLRPGDRLYLVPVPDHSSADVVDLAILAQGVCPAIAHCQTFTTLADGLAVATSHLEKTDDLRVLCGSLYLIGHFLGQHAAEIQDLAPPA